MCRFAPARRASWRFAVGGRVLPGLSGFFTTKLPLVRQSRSVVFLLRTALRVHAAAPRSVVNARFCRSSPPSSGFNARACWLQLPSAGHLNLVRGSRFARACCAAQSGHGGGPVGRSVVHAALRAAKTSAPPRLPHPSPQSSAPRLQAVAARHVGSPRVPPRGLTGRCSRQSTACRLWASISWWPKFVNPSPAAELYVRPRNKFIAWSPRFEFRR